MILSLFIILLINTLYFFQLVKSKIFVISICIIVLTVYVFYLLKVAVLDRVNRNNIFSHKLDFNKPNEVETRDSRSNADGLVEDTKCDSEYEYVEDNKAEELNKKIRQDANKALSKEKCLTQNK